ncbi:type IV CRISPR-associated protein Csf2 [Burkholderia gladioli]|uniref:type IV CRISPR-associated protein Csf2 n=1 Tax=Burkholderia gladioli TaxID=28095 RepID=UPI0016413AF4|nr:type IV CRISPR-associated protein Csf2 [Burkholderia gladioli]
MTIYTIRGAITLTSAAHQTAPERSGNHSPLISTFVKGETRNINLPIITANSVRGVLRRAAASRIAASLLERKVQIPRDLYLSISRGAFSRTGMKTGDATLKEMAAAAKHVHAGLFGGGARMFPSRLAMEDDLKPMVSETRDLFPPQFRGLCMGSAILRGDNGEYLGSSLTTKALLTSRDDFAAGRGIDVIENVESAYLEYIERNLETGAAKKAQKKAKQDDKTLVIRDEDRAKSTNLAGFNTLDVIVPGTRLYFGLRLTSPTPAQLGMTLLAVQDWANQNAVGGGAARGRGRFAPALTLEADGKSIAEPLLDGWAPSYTLADLAIIADAVAAAQAEIAQCTRESLLEVYPISTEPQVEAA